MAWAVHPEWSDWVDKVKSELSEVICTIAGFELVRLLTPTHELDEARARFSGGNVEIIEAPVDDIWMRDIAPTFAMRDEEVIAIDWNFNGWGSTKKGQRDLVINLQKPLRAYSAYLAYLCHLSPTPGR
jgi:agmatine deiminase